MLKGSGESSHLCLAPDLGAETVGLSPLDMILAVVYLFAFGEG